MIAFLANVLIFLGLVAMVKEFYHAATRKIDDKE